MAGEASSGISRFNAAHLGEENGRNAVQSAVRASASQLANVDSVEGESLTLRCNNISNKTLEEEKNVNVRDVQSQLRAENREKAELLADLLGVPQNVNYYTKLFNRASRGELGEDLIKAAFIYTLLQERAGDITSQEPDALGKYFHGVFRRWEPQRTYAAACDAYRKRWKSKTPQGVRSRDKDAIDPFMPFGFREIADMIRRGIRSEEAGWLPFPPGPSTAEVPAQPMGEQEALALAQAMREQASWYLWSPASYPVRSGDTVYYAVEATQRGGNQDGQRWTFTSWDQWLDYHERMLTPPLYLEPALRRGWVSARGAAELQETGERDAHEIACARATCALFAYLSELPPGIIEGLDYVELAMSLSFEELARLGEPIRYPRDRGQAEEPSLGPVAGEGLNVELEEGIVLTYEQFQVRLAEGEYHGECVELEDGGFIPRKRYEELLASGEYVELDDGTPMRADAYEMLQERVRVALSREEAAQRRANVLPEELLEQAGRAEASLLEGQTALYQGGPLPGWWEELCLNEDDGAILDAEAARQNLLLLQSVLDPLLYQLQMRPEDSEDALSFALELSSLCSGWVLIFKSPTQVTRVLEQLAAQQGTVEDPM